MKVANIERTALAIAGRWDIDFHTPAEGIKQFQANSLVRVDSLGFVAAEKRDPTATPEQVFQYIDIASVDVATGAIVTPQELTGDEAPSRARKVVKAYDIIVSTCRPTRGAIAVVPVSLHNQIASTAFTVVRPHDGVNPYYLYYVLRLPSTLEQFRKWSTGSSYPAILDEDVKKSLVPSASREMQDRIAAEVMHALQVREEAIRKANEQWEATLSRLTGRLAKLEPIPEQHDPDFSLSSIEHVREKLPPLTYDLPQRRSRRAEASQPDFLDAL